MHLRNSTVDFKKVLIVDKDSKSNNDRTWCFWTSEKDNWFNEIIYRSWDRFKFKTSHVSKQFDLDPYRYHLIRGIDFYTYCKDQLSRDPRFVFLTAEILTMATSENKGILETSSGTFSASYVFNSAIRTHHKHPDHVNYVQHFKGWVIETESDVFDDTCPVFMDFSVEQHNDCRFAYIIPQSKRKALIEYTGFSPGRLEMDVYDRELKTYIKEHLGITSYTITEEEFGEIPMAESEFVNPFGSRVIPVGSAGGFSKPSTGYTFYFIQRNCKTLIQTLELKQRLVHNKQTKKYAFYDKVLLHVLHKKKIAPAYVFEVLFTRNKIQQLLAFLNEESDLATDLRIMNSVPKLHFVPAAFKKMIGS